MLKITLRKNATLEQRVFDEDGCEDDVYLWSEGNYGCDCNRALFFARAADEDDPVDTPCGDGVAFSLSVANAATGEVLYSELESAPS